MKILFLRVGIDRGCGGTLSPLFSDGTFEYVPIPESSELLEGKGVSYSNLLGRYGGTLDKYSGSTGYTHYDPEFETFTYGEPNEPKRSQLLRLTAGDLLVFYSGFQGPNIAKGTCFVIGYLSVHAIHRAPIDESWPPKSLQHLHRNAHFRRKNSETSLVVVEGDPAISRLFTIAQQLSDDNQKVLADIKDIIGFGGSVMRAIGRWVPETHHDKALKWLNGEKIMTNTWSDSLIDQTCNALNDSITGPDDFLHMKSTKGKFGKIGLEDLLAGKLLIQDKLAAAEYSYSSNDELIADGWAID
jgi:hypothetical protein